MGASVRIEDEAFSDERYEDLAAFAGLADADHARGKMAKLWRQCTIEDTHFLGNQMVSRVLGPGGVDALVRARLGVLLPDGRVRIRGTKGRVEWLSKLRANGKKGGRPKKLRDTNGETRRKPSGFENQNPPAPVPAPAPAPAPTHEDPEKNSARASHGGLELFKAKVDAAVGDIGKRRARRPKAGPTDAERGVALRVLERLGSHNGVRYSGANEHVALVAARMRDGVDEAELRAIVVHCVNQWSDKPEMQEYLRPETLFGPKTHAKYLEPARSRYATEIAEFRAQSAAQPTLSLVPEAG